MTLGVFFAFVAACWLLAWTPGPSMALILANTTTHGLRAGLWTLIGNSTGFVLLVTAACFGMSSIVILMSEWFDVVRWAGAIYLVFLGVTRLKALFSGKPVQEDVRAAPGGRSLFRQGFLVGVSNPKTILFLGAFLPQFVNQAGNIPLQLGVLGATCVIVMSLADAAYTFAVAGLRHGLAMHRLKIMDGIAGVLLVAGGLVLASVHRN